jgi:antibiotic biosynthesis monooxygenase (ABM) superfamily enzyme
MLYITQLIYLKPGKEEAFEAFEAVAIPLIAKYNGKLIQRIRPAAAAFIDGEADRPYEIHVVSFPAESDLAAFGRDPARAAVLHLKDESVERIVMIRGDAI